MRNLILAVLLASGCSFAMPDRAAGPYQSVPDCETSTTKPIVDVIGAGLMFSAGTLLALADAVEEEDLSGGGRELRPYAVGAFAAGGLFTAAAIGGFGKASRCRALSETEDGDVAIQR